MNTRLRNLWIKLSSSFWFVPSLMTFSALLLSFAMIRADEKVKADFISQVSWIYTNKPEGAREVLSTIAGSMITVAGVVFSVTIVALSLASSQFGPRLLRNFMRDKGNQLVLGTFIATFFYCLLILRTIRSGSETSFVPHLSVLVGVLLAVFSLGVLIYFIHHVSESIQVSQVIGRVDQDLQKIIARYFPENLSGIPASETKKTPASGAANQIQVTLFSPGNGYLQAIDYDALLRESCLLNGFAKVNAQPGDFLVKGQPLAVVFSERKCSPEKVAQLQRGFILGAERSLEQDLLFPVNQLVEIAMRALSPSVNDPFTAMACLDRLSAALCTLAAHPPAPATKTDENGVPRVFWKPILFEDFLNAAFNQIRLYARPNPTLMLYFLKRIKIIADFAQKPEHKNALFRHAEITCQTGLDEMKDPQLKQEFISLFNTISAKLT